MTRLLTIVLGRKAQRQIQLSGEDGYGLAKAGLILGWIVVAVMIIGLVPLLVAMNSGPVTVSP